MPRKTFGSNTYISTICHLCLCIRTGYHIPREKTTRKGGEITCICMYLHCNSLSPGLVQHKVRNDSPLAFLLPLSVQDVEIKWGLRELFFCSLQTHVGRIQDDTACYAYVLYISHYTYMRSSRKPPRSLGAQKKVQAGCIYASS